MSAKKITKLVVGIDATKDGWVGVIVDGSQYVDVKLAPTLAELISEVGEVKAIGIDIPIQLTQRGPRDCDGAARKFVGRRSSSVFSVPPKGAVNEASRKRASARSIELNGPGVTAQAFALMPKIKECRRLKAKIDIPIFEVHPEVCFCAMNANSPLESSKKSWDGIHVRIDLLTKHGINLPRQINLKVGVDDVLDAAAAAWSANRVARGESKTLPASAKRGTPTITY